MILQFPAGPRTGPGPGVPGAGGRVASCWGEGDAMRDLGKAKLVLRGLGSFRFAMASIRVKVDD